MHVWLLRAPGSLGQVGMFIGAAGTLGQRRAVGATIRRVGHHSRSGSIHRPSQHSFEAPEGFGIALVSTAVPAVIVFRAGFLSPSRRSGVVRDVVARARGFVS